MRLLLFLVWGGLMWLGVMDRGPRRPEAPPRVTAVEVGHLVRNGGRLEADPTRITGAIWVADDVDFVGHTNRIPLELRHGFGVTFRLGDDVRELKKVRLVVTYPPMVSPQGPLPGRIEREQNVIETVSGPEVYFGYYFDSEWEFVPGVWRLEIRDGDRLLAATEVTTFVPEPK